MREGTPAHHQKAFQVMIIDMQCQAMTEGMPNIDNRHGKLLIGMWNNDTRHPKHW
jgi:hypothetical protein